MAELRDVVVQEQFGPLQGGFQYRLRSGYTALTGRNNVGKSAILQRVFQFLCGDDEFGKDAVCLILPDRSYLDPSTAPDQSDANFGTYNDGLLSITGRGLFSYSTQSGPSRASLTRFLLDHDSLVPHVQRVDRLLER